MSVSIIPSTAGGGLSNSLVAGLIGNNIIDSFAVANNNNITGQFLRDLIGSAFESHKGLQTMTEVAASATAMTAVAASATATTAVAASATTNNTALGSSFSVGAYLDRIRIVGGAATDTTLAAQATMTAVAASATAMNAVAASSTAMNAIWASSTAWNIVRDSNMAVGKFVAGRAGQNAASFADMNAVVASATAMNAVVASSTAMNAVAASATAMTAVAASATAMNAVAASGIALRVICMNASASSIATSALQSRRTTIITTMNAATAQFTRQVNLVIDKTNTAAATVFNVHTNTNSIIIPLTQTNSSPTAAVTYNYVSLANETLIHQQSVVNGTANITIGVAIRGLRVTRNINSTWHEATTYDMYTAVA